MDLGVQGKHAGVAAASSGLGLATATALAAEGAAVAICGRDRGRIDEAASRVGDGTVAMVADVSDPAAADGFVHAATEALGSVDILVTNAGGPPPGTFSTTDVDAYPGALALNLVSVVAMCKAAVPAMRARQWGRVVAITSVTVRQPSDSLILSNTARAGATAFLKTLATEAAPDGVTVNSVQPGLHRTDRLRNLGDPDEMAADVPAGVLGEPDDFASVVTFLCAEQARFVTGAALPVDGGTYRGLQ